MKRTRLSRQSKLRRLQDEVYWRQRREFLNDNPRCQVMVNTDGTLAHRGDRRAKQCKKPSTQVHHVRGRGRWYLDKRFWLAVDADHHEWINTNGKSAEKLGYVQRVYGKH